MVHVGSTVVAVAWHGGGTMFTVGGTEVECKTDELEKRKKRSE